MGLYATVVDSITHYTGLSPSAFFTILALMILSYKLVTSMFVSPDAASSARVQDLTRAYQQDMVREPVHLGEVTEEDLRPYDGTDPDKPLLMCIKGQVYDVSRGRMFYGPGGPYAMFAGRDATRALALMSFDPQDLNGDMEGLSEAELDVLQDWELKFSEKYPKVGVLVTEKKKEGEEGKDGERLVKKNEGQGQQEESKKAV